METTRIKQAFVLGCYEGPEGTNKMRGRKRKTVLYWRKLMKEAGWDHTRDGEGCGRGSRNKGGLTIHQKRTHRAPVSA